MLEGRTPEMKRKLHDAVAEAASQSLEIPKDRIRIQIVEMTPVDHSIGGKTSEK